MVQNEEPERQQQNEQQQQQQQCDSGDGQSWRDIFDMKYPINRGKVVNWADMEKIFDHIFREQLDVAPEDYPVLLTETPLNSGLDREIFTEMMFEGFNACSTYLANQAVMSLLASGKTTGFASLLYYFLYTQPNLYLLKMFCSILSRYIYRPKCAAVL